MKFKNNKLGRVLLIALSITSCFSMQSCKDEPDKYESTGGTPTIYYIRPADINSKDSLLVQAGPQFVIAIVGENLRSIKQMFFNDLEAVLNSSYITDNTLIVTTPKNIPSAVNDKITMITHNQDTVYYDFHIVIPGPVVTSMSNEYAKPGNIVTIYGSYFIDDPNIPLQVTLPDGKIITEFTDQTENAITFVMPECTQEGNITVTTIYGKTKSSFHYLDSRGILFDFDTPNAKTGAVLGNHGWHPQKIESDETSLSGNYLRLGDPDVTLAADGAWNDGKFSFEGTTDSTCLCMLYSAARNEINAAFLREPGEIVIKLTETPGESRVSGTPCNDEWQRLNDSVMVIGKEINRIAEHIC